MTAALSQTYQAVYRRMNRADGFCGCGKPCLLLFSGKQYKRCRRCLGWDAKAAQAKRDRRKR
jgi:hypothetical protein